MSDDEGFDRALRRLADAKAANAKASAAAKRAKSELDDAEGDVYERMVERGDKSVTRDLGEGYGEIRFNPRATPWGRVLDEETAIAALEAAGHSPEATLRHEVRKKLLNDLVKEHLDHQTPLPDGVDYYYQRGVTVTRKKSK